MHAFKKGSEGQVIGSSCCVEVMKGVKEKVGEREGHGIDTISELEYAQHIPNH